MNGPPVVPEAGAGRAGGDGLAVAPALVGRRLLVGRRVVLPEAAEDGGEAVAAALVEVAAGEGGEADAVELVGEPLGLVADGPGVEDVGGDAPEHEVGRHEGPLGQALDGLRCRTGGQFNSFVEISTDFSTDFSTKFL